MKLVRKNLTPDGPGTIKITPEEDDDVWHAYNLVSVGDKVSAPTVRKVIRETGSGGKVTERMHLTLEIKAEEVDYEKETPVLRVRGKNILQNEHVKIGQYHTLEIDRRRTFVLRKAIWDSFALDVLRQACDPAASADLAVVLMQEGLAHIFLIGRSITSTRSRIETSIPRKHGPAIAGYETALNKFFEHVLQAFLKHIDFGVVRCVVIASPGFTKRSFSYKLRSTVEAFFFKSTFNIIVIAPIKNLDQFRDYLLLEAERRQLKSVIENKSRLLLVHSTSGYKHSLKEVLEAPNITSMIKDTKAAQEVRALKDFFSMLSNDPDRACYGPKHVEVAHERMAIRTLLITDSLVRNSDTTARLKYVNLIESVKKFGGTAHVFSSMHVSGEQLAQLTGIAAILQFPLPELEDIEV